MVQNGPESLGVPKAVEGSSSKFPIKVRLQGESRWDESPSTPAASFPAQVEKGGFRSALDALTHLAGRKKDSPANQVSEYQAAREAKREELRSVVQASLAAHAVLSPLIMQVDQQAILKRAYGDKYGDLLGKAEAVGPMLAGFAGLGNEPSAYASAVQAA
ncbi:MAG: hypothetical protein KGL95_00680, partial [Patescibacteria group bacterium]|nr:hypothetical protein [Patescibacteria group bacterium]